MELSASMERPSPLVPGYFLDRYELLCPIAEGGMASVWVARLQGKHGFEKLFAVKTILPQHAADSRFQQMFLDEARIASRIAHTNVAQILDLGEQHDILYIVMEWVDGDSLSLLYRTLKQKDVALPHGVLLRVIGDACGGLHAAHELAGPDGKSLNVVHRDVTPQNVLVSTLGVARLIDFGIAKARDRLGEDTNAGMLKGKLHYMAPEQALGGEVDRRTDVFAIGAVLYRMLAHKPAFEAKSPKLLLARMASKEPPPPLPPGVHPAVAQLVMRALALEPRDRFATAAELQTAIEGAMVQAKLGCTTGDVARYVKEHLGAADRKRRDAIEVAIGAAKERQRIREVLKPQSSDSTLSGAGSSSGPLPAVDGALLAGSSSGILPVGSTDGEEPISIAAAPSNKKRTIAIAAGCVVLGAVASLAIAMALRRPPPPQVIVEQATPAASTVIIVAAPPPTTPPSSSADSLSVDDLPKPAVGATPHASGHAPPHKRRFNYGF